MKRVALFFTFLVFFGGVTVAGVNAASSRLQIQKKLLGRVHEVEQEYKKKGIAHVIRRIRLVARRSHTGNGAYVVLFKRNGRLVANERTEAFNGMNMFYLRSSDGRLFVRDMIRAAEMGGGCVSYRVLNKVKIACCKKLDDTYIVCAISD